VFGRRRHATAVEAPVVQERSPELSSQQTFELLQRSLSGLIGAQGTWTLVPRSSDDTETIFHDLKADEIARHLAAMLQHETEALRGGTPRASAVGAGRDEAAGPVALPWEPAPISIWADPRRATVTDPVELPVHAETRLVA
jgi:hypothetical protein